MIKYISQQSVCIVIEKEEIRDKIYHAKRYLMVIEEGI
jgi:hypothetical protein